MEGIEGGIMKKVDIALIEVILYAMGMLGIACIDVGASAQNLLSAGYNVTLVGLFFTREPSFQYHLGLALVFGSLTALFFLALITLFGDENDK